MEESEVCKDEEVASADPVEEVAIASGNVDELNEGDGVALAEPVEELATTNEKLVSENQTTGPPSTAAPGADLDDSTAGDQASKGEPAPGDQTKSKKKRRKKKRKK